MGDDIPKKIKKIQGMMFLKKHKKVYSKKQFIKDKFRGIKALKQLANLKKGFQKKIFLNKPFRNQKK